MEVVGNGGVIPIILLIVCGYIFSYRIHCRVIYSNLSSPMMNLLGLPVPGNLLSPCPSTWPHQNCSSLSYIRSVLLTPQKTRKSRRLRMIYMMWCLVERTMQWGRKCDSVIMMTMGKAQKTLRRAWTQRPLVNLFFEAWSRRYHGGVPTSKSDIATPYPWCFSEGLLWSMVCWDDNLYSRCQ